MENKTKEQIQSEIVGLKAGAYDVSSEINRLSSVLQQINTRIAELDKYLQQLNEQLNEESVRIVKGKKSTKTPF